MTTMSADISGGSGSRSRTVASPLAFLTFFKSLFGSGLLALPSALGSVGLPLGSAVYLAVSLACALSCHFLLVAAEVCRGAEAGACHEDGKSLPLRGFPDISGCDQEEDRNKPSQLPRRKGRGHLFTYGDLSDLLLGSAISSVARWTVIVLNILFASGLVIVVCENLGGYLAERHYNDGYHDEPENIQIVMAYRHKVGIAILPIVVALLQIPWLQDMWIISAVGLAVYSVGVIGSTLYSAAVTILDSDSNDADGELYGTASAAAAGIPADLWQLKWDGVPAFVGSAVYALEGIMLALPTVRSMTRPEEGSTVVCSALILYGLLTLIFAVLGYMGGLGGGTGTGRTAQLCDVVTSCINPPALRSALQLALSAAMILSIPVMLYPSTEMLEFMLTAHRPRQREDEHTWFLSKAGQSHSVDGAMEGTHIPLKPTATSGTSLLKKAMPHSVRTYHAATENRERWHTDVSPPPPLDMGDSGFTQGKSWKLRVFLALLVTGMGTALSRSFAAFSGLVGAVGLSFAGFVLPPVLYHEAMVRADISIGRGTMLMMTGLILFGLYNMIAGGTSSLIKIFRT